MEGTGITLKKKKSAQRWGLILGLHMVLGKVPEKRWSQPADEGRDGHPPGATPGARTHAPSRAAAMRSGTAARLSPRPSKRQLPGGKPSKHRFIFPLQGREPGLVKRPNMNYPTKLRHSPTVLSMLISKAKTYSKPWLTRLQNLPNSSEVCFG